MSRSSFRKLFAISCFIVFPLTGCSALPNSPQVSFVGKAAVIEASKDKLMALVQGRLRETDQCVILSAEGGGDYLPVFPEGDFVAGDSAGEYALRGTTLTMGEPVSFGGGELTPPPGTSLGLAAARCGVAKVWLVS